tara:strand:+ start:1027 stop:1218 length:192 start_codon:yes stop_codon:yes gene_type:complete
LALSCCSEFVTVHRLKVSPNVLREFNAAKQFNDRAIVKKKLEERLLHLFAKKVCYPVSDRSNY